MAIVEDARDENGAIRDGVVIRPGGNVLFNPLMYLLRAGGPQAAAQAMREVIQAELGDAPQWDGVGVMHMTIRYIIEGLAAAFDYASITDVMAWCNSARLQRLVTYLKGLIHAETYGKLLVYSNLPTNSDLLWDTDDSGNITRQWLLGRTGGPTKLDLVQAWVNEKIGTPLPEQTSQCSFGLQNPVGPEEPGDPYSFTPRECPHFEYVWMQEVPDSPEARAFMQEEKVHHMVMSAARLRMAARVIWWYESTAQYHDMHYTGMMIRAAFQSFDDDGSDVLSPSMLDWYDAELNACDRSVAVITPDEPMKLDFPALRHPGVIRTVSGLMKAVEGV